MCIDTHTTQIAHINPMKIVNFTNCCFHEKFVFLHGESTEIPEVAFCQAAFRVSINIAGTCACTCMDMQRAGWHMQMWVTVSGHLLLCCMPALGREKSF